MALMPPFTFASDQLEWVLSSNYRGCTLQNSGAGQAARASPFDDTCGVMAA